MNEIVARLEHRLELTDRAVACGVLTPGAVVAHERDLFELVADVVVAAGGSGRVAVEVAVALRDAGLLTA